MFIIYRSEAAASPIKETWENANEGLRQAILKASQCMNRQLGQDPQEQGESRDGSTRILFHAPLAAVFEVDQTKKVVRILRTWVYRTTEDGLCDCD